MFEGCYDMGWEEGYVTKLYPPNKCSLAEAKQSCNHNNENLC